MNWEHLRTILWLRWRMSLNQLKRGGIANTIILAMLAIIILGSSIALFFVALFVGLFTIPRSTPIILLYVWDIIVFFFLMLWMIGLLAELQRSEVLSLQKLLHLPISLGGTFLVNYIGSLVSLTMVICLPGMIGLCIAMVAVKGVAMMAIFPLLFGFLLMITAITYQFQGWLAALMVNQRKRRTVIVVVTMSFVLVFQLPNLFNILFQRQMHQEGQAATKLAADLEQVDRQRAAGQITVEDQEKQREQLQAQYKELSDRVSSERKQRIESLIARVNIYVPVGWLPYGVKASADGNVVPALLGTAGMGLVGAISLRRCYRTTLRLYTGQFTSRARPSTARAMPSRPADMRFLERRLPGLSEHASALALANFRSLTRAPEAKMVLLSPAIMTIVFGAMLLTHSISPPDPVRPLLGFGAIAMILLTIMQLIGNQFGLDRDGFRVLVLCSASRRDILLAKNVSIAPLAIVLGTIALSLLQAVYPMKVAHFLASLAELVAMFLVCAMIGNFTSIYAPMSVAAGSLKPAHPKAITILIQLLFFILFPVVFGVAMLPLGLELLLHHFNWLNAVPIYLIAACLELAGVGLSYHYLIRWQGALFQSREQKILAIVTSKVE